MSLDTWLIFLLASIGLSLSPGPNVLLALTHGVLHGRRKTGFTILGGVLGFGVLIGLSLFGIGALLRASLGWALFQQGALAALTNPKALLFFAAFLPQFIDPQGSLLLQFAVMAGTFAAVETITEVLIVCLAGQIAPWLGRVGKRFNQVCGGMFMAIGVALPLRG